MHDATALFAHIARRRRLARYATLARSLSFDDVSAVVAAEEADEEVIKEAALLAHIDLFHLRRAEYFPRPQDWTTERVTQEEHEAWIRELTKNAPARDPAWWPRRQSEP